MISVTIHPVIVKCKFSMLFDADVIGMLTAIGTEREIERNGVRTKMNVIALDSDG